jgi:hypothetical protein
MPSRLRYPLALAGLLVLGSCTDQPVAAPPMAGQGMSSNLTAAPCPNISQMVAQIRALFPRPTLVGQALADYFTIVSYVDRGDLVTAQSLMFSLVKFTLKTYYQNQLIGQKSLATRTAVVNFIDGLYCMVGLAQPHIPPAALGEDGAVAVVTPSSPTTTIVTQTLFAGVQVPAAAVPTTTTISVVRLPDSPGPLNTGLDQYPAFYEFTASPTVTFLNDVTVATCQIGTFSAQNYGRLKLGHNVGTGFELLPRVTPAFINCTGLAAVTGDPSINGTCCLGGIGKNFSPFGAVDTLASVDRGSPATFTGSPNSPVPPGNLPRVAILTPTGRPVPGVTVTFALTPGSAGSISGAVQVTNASGVAALGGWTLGPSASTNVVTATGTPLPGSGFFPNGVSFTATVP